MPPKASSNSSSSASAGGNSSSSHGNASISQHIKKFYGLLCDGGLNLPSFDEIQFGKITIGSKKKSSFSSMSSFQVKDAMLLRRHIEKEVARRTKTDIENFCFALKSMIEDEYFFCLCLVPLESTNEGSGTYFSSNESFFKLLLNISTIQMNIIEILFEELLNKCQDYEEEAYEQWDKNIPKLIISQMRWLDLIVDSKKLTEHLSTILQISSIEFTKELISAIPEIIDDSEHDNIVEKLDQVMQDKSEMTTCVIDALSNLNLKKEILNETIDRVLRNLNSASLSDLPVIIRFLLQSTNDDNIKSVVQGIRKDLDISSLNDQQQDNNDENDNRMRDDDENDGNTSLILSGSSNSKGKGKATIGGDNSDEDDDDIFYSTQQQKRKGKQFIENNQSSLQCESLLVSAISTGIRHRKIIEKSFIQQILNEQDDEHSIIDLWILFIIYSIPNYRKDSEQVLKKKIKNRKIDLNLLKLSIEGHGEALEQIFLSLLELSSFLLRNTTDYQISLFGQGMYCYLFNSFKNDYNRQKIIQSLITHVGSNSKIEKDSSLDVLLSISYTKLSILRNYSSFFQVLIDSLTNLTDQQLRKVYKLFSILSFTKTLTNNNNNNTRTRDELMIIIRKQLSNTNFNFKKMGIIGSCTILSIIGSNFNQFNQSNNNLNTSINSNNNNTNQQQKQQQNLLNSNQQDLNNEEYEQCIELLDFSLKCCYKIPIFKTLLYDELCFVIKERNLDERLLQEIQTRLIHDFFQRFIIEKSDMKQLKSNYFDYKIQFSIENSQQYVNILPLLEKEDESIWNLFSQFRLMKIVMDKLKSDYSNFLLQSGIVLFDLDEIMQQFKHFNRKEKDLICTSLFFTINWFREVLNGFTFSSNDNNNNEDDDDETNDNNNNNNNSEKYKYILERIENLNLLEKTLDKCLSMNLTFHLPTIGTNTTISTSTTTTTTTNANSTTSLDSKKKKKKDDDDDNDSHNDDDNNDDEEDEDTTSSSSNVKSKSSSSEYTSLPSKRKYLSNFKIHYRELDLSVISIIKYNNTTSNTDNADNDSNNNSLQPLQLFYIIEDLQSKLKSVIARSKTTFFTSKEKDNHYNLNRINTNDFYEILFDILPYIYKYIKIISKDSIKQSNNEEHENNDDDEYITPCFQLLIDILLKVFDHFKDDFNRIINLLLLSNVNNLIENENENDLSNKDSEELIEIFYFSIKELVMELNIFDICYKLFELLKCIVIKSNLTKLKIDIQGIAKHLLQTPFPSVIKSESLGNLISGLISFGSWITGTNELIECLKDKLTNHKTSEDEDSQKHLDFNFPNITKTTIPICIKKIFIELSNKISNQELLEWKENQIQKNLKRIHQVISFYKLLTSLTKSEKTTPQLLQSTLMGSKLLLANFLKLIRFLGKYLKTNKEFVIKIFTNLNRANRQVQTICIDRKLALNKSLAKIIPKIKKDLESCNLKTKVILKQNGVENAITISVITDRDVTGKEASSQHFYSQLIVQSSESSAADKKRKRKNQDDENDENDENEENNEEEQVEEKPKKKKKKKKSSDEGDDEESKKKKKKKKKDEEEEDEEPKKKKKKKKSEENDENEEEKPKKKKKKKKKSSDEGDDEEPKKKKKKKKKSKHTSDEHDEDPIEEDEEVSSKRKKKESKKKSKNLMEDDNDPIEEHVFEESLAADSPRETTIFDDDDNAIFDDNESLTDFIAPPNNQDDISNYDVTKSLPESRDDFMDDEAEEVEEEEEEDDEQIEDDDE